MTFTPPPTGTTTPTEAKPIEPCFAAAQGTSQLTEEIVYYVQDNDGLIKIGTTTQFETRIRGLTRKHGPLMLLAAELGGYLREQQRHKEFVACRVWPDREWFKPAVGLLQHIERLALGGPFPIVYPGQVPYLSTPLQAAGPLPQQTDRRLSPTAPNPDGGSMANPDDQLFKNTPVPSDEPLFSRSPSKPRRASRPQPARPQTVSILQLGDVVAAGLTNGKCPVGQVTAVDDHGFRLALYSWVNSYFTAGTAVILWHQVSEFKVAKQGRDDVYEMDPLADFQTAWTSKEPA